MNNNIKQMLENIRTWQDIKGFTQENIADAIGIQPESVSRLITGVNNISLKRLKQIADFFDISVIQLLSKPEDIQRDIQVTELLKKMDPETYKAWLQVGNVMVSKNK